MTKNPNQRFFGGSIEGGGRQGGREQRGTAGVQGQKKGWVGSQSNNSHK